MAERRMFAKSIVESARFLKMPISSQALYFHLCLNADDDGIVEAYSVLNLLRAHEDDLRVLSSKGFVRILNLDLVTYIEDWREQNKIRPDRKKDSIYMDLLLSQHPDIKLLQKKNRSDTGNKSGPSTDRPLSAQCSVGEDSIGKGSIEECSKAEQNATHTILYKLGNEILTNTDYLELVRIYSRDTVDCVISRIMNKPYHGCLNVIKISEWCSEKQNGTSQKCESGRFKGVADSIAGERIS